MLWIKLNRSKIKVFGKQAKILMKGMTAPEEHTHFLHSLLTNNIRVLKEGEFNYNLWLKPNGSPVGEFFVYKFKDFYLLDTSLEADLVIEEFNKLKLSLKVYFEDLTSSYEHVFVFGEGASEFIKDVAGAVPEEGKFVIKGNFIVARNDIRLKEEGYDIIGDLKGIELKGEEISYRDFEDLRIERCVPAIGKELREGFSPLEANVLSYAIDMNKGCYVGQEAIARVYYRGRTPRALVKLKVEGSVKENEDIFNSSGKKVGLITSVNSKGDLALGYVLRATLDKGEEIKTQKASLKIVCQC